MVSSEAERERVMSSSEVMAYGTNLREEMLNRVNKHREAKLLWRYPHEKPSFDNGKLFVIVMNRRYSMRFSNTHVVAYPVECTECKIGWHWEIGDSFYTPEKIDAWAEVPEFVGWRE